MVAVTEFAIIVKNSAVIRLALLYYYNVVYEYEQKLINIIRNKLRF